MRYEVDSAQVAHASAAIQATAGRISSENDSMERQLLELQSSWQGTAAMSFQHVFGDWRRAQQQVQAALEQIRSALAATGRQYEEAEAAAVRMFSG